MQLIIILICIGCFIKFIPFRLFCLHPLNSLKLLLKDLYFYFKYKQYNICPSGQIKAYVGLFGKGKTLSAVYRVRQMYKRYNGLKVYDKYTKKWYTQRIIIYSNVHLKDTPYQEFKGFSDLLFVTKSKMQDSMLKHNILPVYIFLGDEFGAELNSRSFKTNLDPLVLNTLLTCRHYRISLLYTAQRFNHVDALLRQVTSYVVCCNKVGRFMVHNSFEAFDVENAGNVKLLKPCYRGGFVIKDSDYESYSTLSCVKHLIKDVKNGNMLSSEEVLLKNSPNTYNFENVTNVKGRYKGRLQK